MVIPPDGDGDCCVPHETTGCDDEECTAIVCGNDSFCCESQWDSLCADAANNDCKVCEGGGSDTDDTGDTGGDTGDTGGDTGDTGDTGTGTCDDQCEACLNYIEALAMCFESAGLPTSELDPELCYDDGLEGTANQYWCLAEAYYEADCEDASSVSTINTQHCFEDE